MSEKRKRRRLPNFLRGPEIDRFLAASAAIAAAAKRPAGKARTARDHLILQCGLYLGLRVSELTKLRVEDLDLRQGIAMVVEGKGGKDRAIPIHDELLAALRTWIGTRTSGYVFTNSRGGKLSTRALQLMVKKVAARADIPRNVKTHTLRHSFATRLLETGAGIHEVRDLLGHSSVAVTEQYVHSVPERLRGAVSRLGTAEPIKPPVAPATPPPIQQHTIQPPPLPDADGPLLGPCSE